MAEESYKTLKKYAEKKLGLPIINILFIFDVVLLQMFGKQKRNYLIWNHVDFGTALSKIGMKFYSTNMFIGTIIIILLVVFIISFLFDKTDFFNIFPSNDYTNNITASYNPVSAVFRLLYVIWYLIHDIWIVFFTILLLSGHNNIYYNPLRVTSNAQTTNYILLILNTLVVVVLLIRALFLNRFKTRILNKEIDPYDSSKFRIINQGVYSLKDSEANCFLVKDIILDEPLFYFVKTKEKLPIGKNTNFISKHENYYIVNYSRNFNEIKYEFEAEMKDTI